MTAVTTAQTPDAAVTKNREAGLWVRHDDIAGYFTKIFETDWKAAFSTPEEGVSGAVADRDVVAKGGFVRVAPCDYEEV